MNVDRARDALAAQPFSALLGTRLLTFSPSGGTLALDARADLRQQDELADGGLPPPGTR
jgi:acyl-coenzyme A thioesterase PaaI-like protein